MQRSVSPGRVEIGPVLSDAEIESLAADPTLHTIQLTQPPKPDLWRRLNARLFGARPDVTLAVYGFPGAEACDLGFAVEMTHVERFSVAGLQRAVNVDRIAAMPRLRELTLGIFDLDSLAVLAAVTPELTTLRLGATKAKLDLAVLERFVGLSRLAIEKQRKNIDVIGTLAGLEDLTLYGVGMNDIRCLAPLTRLRDLRINLGSITDLSAIAGKGTVRYLELVQMRGLDDIGAVSSLTGLQYLFLQSLPHVTALPDLRKLAHLRRIHLEKMKGLTSITPAADAPALKAFLHVAARLSPDDHAVMFRNPALKRIDVGFGSTAKNAHFRALAQARGLAPVEGPFVFR